MADELINQLQDTTGVGDEFDLENLQKMYLESVQAADTASVKTLTNISKNILAAQENTTNNHLNKLGVEKPSDVEVDGLVINWKLNDKFEDDVNAYKIDWGMIEEKYNFPSINPKTNQPWQSIDELYDMFDVDMDIAGTSLDPTTYSGDASHWDDYDFQDNSKEKYPRLVGNDFQNHIESLNNGISNNPYHYFTSAYVAGGGRKGWTYRQGYTTVVDPYYDELHANIAMNMFRFNLEELSPVEYTKFYGTNRNYMESDVFHPLANVGDYETAQNGLTLAPFVSGFLASKYNDLNNSVIKQKGHYVNNIDTGEPVFIDQPETWNGGAGGTYEANAQMIIKEIVANNGLTQADFMGKFGPSHNYMGIFNGDRNSTGLTSQGTNISGHTFFAEESIPGHYNLYSAGNSMLALGVNFDPTSSTIQSIRFGDMSPMPSGHMMYDDKVNTWLDASFFEDNGMHYYGVKNMVNTFGSQYDSGMFESQGWNHEGDIDVSPSMRGAGFTAGQLSINAYLGFSRHQQGAYLSSTDWSGAADGSAHGTWSAENYTAEYSKYSVNRGLNIHDNMIPAGGLTFFYDRLPNFSKSTFVIDPERDATAGYRPPQHSNTDAYVQGEVAFKKFLVYVLENANSNEYHIQKAFEDLVTGINLIGVSNYQGTQDALDALDDVQKTYNTNRSSGNNRSGGGRPGQFQQ